MEIEPFSYMGWAKREGSGSGHRLTRSGTLPPPARILHPLPELFALEELESYGPPATKALIAARHGLTPDRVFLVPGGASMALFLVGMVLLDRDDLVLAEEPGYESLHRFAQFPRARVRPFRRQDDARGTPDLDSLEKGLAEGARLVVLTNLHNPYGTDLGREGLQEILTLAERAGARVVCDEVFAEFLPPGERPPACQELSPTALTLSSFTKAFGLGSLRQGWILADPETVERLALAFDLMGVASPTLPLLVVHRLLEREEEARAWLRRELAGVPAALDRLGRHPRLRFPRPAGGVTLFPTVRGWPDTTPLCAELAGKHGVHVVPGRFFGAPERIRLGLGLPPAELEACITAFLAALDACRPPDPA